MRILRLFRDLFLPPRCPVCGRRMAVVPGRAAALLCLDCAFLWEAALRAQCPVCYAAYPDCRCVPSVMRRAGVSTLVKLGAYDGETTHKPIRTVILRAKRRRCRHLFDYLAGELRPGLLQALQQAEVSPERCVLTWLPRARRGLIRYGVDQAEELARALSRLTDIPAERLLRRRREGKPQKELTAKERLENLKTAFAVTGDPGGRVVLLCDDLVTTGAGMAAGGRLLKTAGASDVIGVSVAVTPKKKNAPKPVFEKARAR